MGITTLTLSLITKHRDDEIERGIKKIELQRKEDALVENSYDAYIGTLDGVTAAWSFNSELNDSFVQFVEEKKGISSDDTLIWVTSDKRETNSTPYELPNNTSLSLLSYRFGVWYDFGIFNGPPGKDGTECWDTNKDDICTQDESTDGDHKCDWRDCRTTESFKALCWDLDKDGVCDIATEDIDEDGTCDVYDCLGRNGIPGVNCWITEGNTSPSATVASCRGEDGANGIHCWDLDRDNICGATEDKDGNSVCDPRDCVGQDGANGTNGLTGLDGLDGRKCWDLNANRFCDITTEDKNLDGVCNTTDCSFGDGENGLDGLQFYHCWDLNTDGICTVALEDVNFDNSCSYLDCRGTKGNNGLNGTNGTDGKNGTSGSKGLQCWDYNINGVCDITDVFNTNEDVNDDGKCDQADCLGSNSGDAYIYRIVDIGIGEGEIFWIDLSHYATNISQQTNSWVYFYVRSHSVTDLTNPPYINGVPIAGKIIYYDGASWFSIQNALSFVNSEIAKGEKGLTGNACWDKDSDRVCGLLEDSNGDGECDYRDCSGVNYPGIDGNDGINGVSGDNGYDCFDVNRNRLCDISTEDLDGNTLCTTNDCRGVRGTNGLNGTDGYPCWDLNQNRICDLLTEDTNKDDVCGPNDCRGANGVTGSKGFPCWSSSTSICNSGLDVTGDGSCNYLDCRSPNFGLQTFGSFAITPTAITTATPRTYTGFAPSNNNWYGAYYTLDRSAKVRYMKIYFVNTQGAGATNVKSKFKIFQSANGSVFDNTKQTQQIATAVYSYGTGSAGPKLVDFGSVFTLKCCGFWLFRSDVESTSGTARLNTYSQFSVFGSPADKFNLSPYYNSVLNIDPSVSFTEISITNMNPTTFESTIVIQFSDTAF